MFRHNIVLNLRATLSTHINLVVLVFQLILTTYNKCLKYTSYMYFRGRNPRINLLRHQRDRYPLNSKVYFF